MLNLPKVLIVEDDRSIASALALVLEKSYEIEVAASGQLALVKTKSSQFDIIVLDLNLPDMPGMVVCQELRNRGITAPILVLSGESKILTKINLLDAGANDYLTKPFSVGELKARLRVLSRIGQTANYGLGKQAVHGVVIDRQAYVVNREGVTIQLRRKEFAVLEYLLEHAGQVVSRDRLLHSVWPGSDHNWTNKVDVHISYLREKLDRPFPSPLIKTVHGHGYKIDAPTSSIKAGAI